MPDPAPNNRKTIRQRIEDVFSENLRTEYKSSYLHAVFGSAFRTRVSELNRIPDSPIVIRNRVTKVAEMGHSVYWLELNAT